MDMTDPLLSSQEAKKVLKVSRQTLWRLEKMGAVTPVKIGTVKRYRSSEITGAKKIK
jgi:predicted DNA-binding transcriptional regulator AlpA